MSQNIIVEPNEITDEPQEDEEAQAQTTEEVAADESIPEKYRGKTFEDVIKMHQNLEKEYGRQANEVGTYRELVSSLAESKRASDLSQPDTTDKPVEVTSDDIFDNPSEAIAKVVKSVLERELAPIQQSQQATQREAALAQLQRDYPDLESIGADPDFQQYVSSNEYRLMDAQKWVSDGDVNAARRLLDDYKSARKDTAPAQEEAPTTPATRQKVVQTDSGRGGATPQKEILHRDEVMRLIAKDPERYRSPSFQAKLRKAIEEGRFVE